MQPLHALLQWRLQQQSTLDFQPSIEKNLVKFLFLNINKKLIYETMTNEILSGEYDRIVLDSITPLSEMPIYLRNIETNTFTK